MPRPAQRERKPHSAWTTTTTTTTTTAAAAAAAALLFYLLLPRIRSEAPRPSLSVRASIRGRPGCCRRRTIDVLQALPFPPLISAGISPPRPRRPCSCSRCAPVPYLCTCGLTSDAGSGRRMTSRVVPPIRARQHNTLDREGEGGSNVKGH